MPIAVVYRPPAMTEQQYKDSWGGGPPVAPPPGLVFHAGLGEGPEFMTMTVWESLDAYEAFAPMFAKIMGDKGFTFGKPTILAVHHYLDPHQR